MGIFSINSPLVKAMTFIGKLIMLNICWFAFSIPILTIGASTSAMYAMMFKVVKKEDEKIFAEFFAEFKRNFKKGTGIFLLLLVFGAFVALEILYAMGGATTMHKVCLYVGAFGFFIFVVISMFAYIIQARYENSVITTIKNSILLAGLSPFTVIKFAIIWAVPVAVSIVNHDVYVTFGVIWVICGTALQFYFSTKVILPVFGKVIREEEKIKKINNNNQ